VLPTTQFRSGFIVRNDRSQRKSQFLYLVRPVVAKESPVTIFGFGNLSPDAGTEPEYVDGVLSSLIDF